MHEATRRILGVLLRQLDGFEGKRSIVIGATNRKQDLDPALRSRFDTSIFFQLPNPTCRSELCHLTSSYQWYISFETASWWTALWVLEELYNEVFISKKNHTP